MNKIMTAAAVRAITHAGAYEGFTDPVRQDIACGYLAREVYMHCGPDNEDVVVATFRAAMSDIKAYYSLDFFSV